MICFVRSTLCVSTMVLLSNTTPFADLLDVLRRFRTPALLVTTAPLKVAGPCDFTSTVAPLISRGPLASIEYVKPGWVRANLAPLGDWYHRVAAARLARP